MRRNSRPAYPLRQPHVMTREELESRYQLVEQVTEGDIRTHHAVAFTGAAVMVHFLRAGSPAAERILGAVRGLPPEDADRVIEVVEVGGDPVVVTRFLMDEGTLEGWLGLEEPVPPEGGTDEPEIETDEPGEFTRMFKLGALDRNVEAPPPAAPTEPPPAAPPEPPPSAARPDPPSPPTPPGPPDPVPAAPPSDPSGPGEFTRLFRAVRPGPGEVPAVPPEGPDAGSPSPPAPEPPSPSPSPSPPPPPPPAPPPSPPPEPRRPAARWQVEKAPDTPAPPPPGTPKEPGAFTREFGRMTPPPAAPPAPPPLRAPSPGAPPHGASARPDAYLERLRRASPSSGGAPASGPTPPPPPPAAPSVGAPPGPSEFTRVVSAISPSAGPPAPGTPKPAAPPPPAAPRRGGGGGAGSVILLVGGMALVFLLALGLVLFFALREPGEPEPAVDDPDVPAEARSPSSEGEPDPGSWIGSAVAGR